MCTMRNIVFYIFFISGVTVIYGKNEAEAEILTEEDFEDEAKRDMENLLKNTERGTAQHKNDLQTKNTYEIKTINATNQHLIDNLDNLLKQMGVKTSNNNKNIGSVLKENLRYGDKPNSEMMSTSTRFNRFMKRLNSFNREADKKHLTNTNDQIDQLTKKLDLNHRNVVVNKIIENNEFLSHDKNPLRQLMKQLAENFVAYPEGYNYQQQTKKMELKPRNARKTATAEFRAVSHLHDDDPLESLMKHLYSQHNSKYKETRRYLTTSDVVGFDNNEQSHPYLKLLDTVQYKDNGGKSEGYLRSSGEVDFKGNDILHQLVEQLDVKHKDKGPTNEESLRNTNMLDSGDNEILHQLLKSLDKEQKQIDDVDTGDKRNNDVAVEGNMKLKTLRHISTYNGPIPPRSHGVENDNQGRRIKRSTFTQAGYTQDPDTCKTYNENLVKLWSNLSKYINVTQQPDERALHNIAIMIQAYLDHQNSQSFSETPKLKHENGRDKISEVILKIKKMLDEAEASPDKIIKLIIKYIRPFYGDVENEDCQQVNEESLISSVELLYKNYLENAECHNDGGMFERTKELNFRKRMTKNVISQPTNWQHANTEYKPEGSILSEDELYKDFHKGKMPRERSGTKTRRVFKRSRKEQSRRVQSRKSPSLVHRSGNKNINSEKIKSRSRFSQKSNNKRLKKSSLKTDAVKSKCEKFAIRKFTVSLRPVIERFMALLECQLDNTMRSRNYNRVLTDPYYLYASKYDTKKDSLRQENNLANIKLTRKNTQRRTNISHRKSPTINRYNTSNEYDINIFGRNDKNNNYPFLRKYNLEQITRMNSAPSVVDSFIDWKESNTGGDKEYITSYNEYFQSPPLYDDYDGIFKTNTDNANGFPDSLNTNSENENIVVKLINKNLVLPLNKQANDNLRNNADNKFYEKDLTEVIKQNKSEPQTVSNNTHVSIVSNITQLRNDEKLTDAHFAQSQDSVKSFESITEFLKEARDASLQTPEFAVPFALDSDKGYVELTHLVKYPKTIVYHPQFIVKNTIPYDDFLKTINSFNMSNDEVRLMKIVRHLPDNTVKVLFETEDVESPLEVLNFKDNRRSGVPFTEVKYPVKSRTDLEDKNANLYDNADFTDKYSFDHYVSVYRDETLSNIASALVRSDRLFSDDGESQSASNSDLDSYTETTPTVDSFPSSPPESSLNSGLTEVLSNLGSGLISSSSSGSDSGSGLGSAIGSVVGAKIGSSINEGLNTALNIGLKSPQLSSYLNKLLPSHTDSHLSSHSNVHSDSNSNSYSHLTLGSDPIPSITNRNPEIELPSTSESTINRWWKKWKNIFTGKMKRIVEKMASLTDIIDHIVKL